MQVVHARGIDQWAQMCSESFVPLRTAGDDTFRGSITHVDVGDVGVSHVASTRSRVFRPARLISAEPRDDVLLSIHLAGTGRVDQQGRSAPLVPGAAALYEADRPYDLSFGGSMRELVLQVPRRRLAMRDAQIRESCARTVQATTPSLEVLRHLLAGIVRAGCPPTMGERLAETAVDLLGAVLDPLAGERGERRVSSAAMAASARAHMERRFCDPATDVENVARHLGVSRRYLEALFAREGQSPADYLRRLRLEHARGLLTDTTRAVTDVAFASGFQDVSTFGRAFRRRFGLSPRELRQAQDAGVTG